MHLLFRVGVVNSCFVSIDVCFLFDFSFLCLHVCAYAFKSNIRCGSALGPGASGLPYYCTPPVCVPAVVGGLTVWRHNKQKKNSLLLWRWQRGTEPMYAWMSTLQTGMSMSTRALGWPTMTMTTMPTTMISTTLLEKSSLLHSWPRLLSTLISLLAPSTPTSTLIALAFSLHSPPSSLPSPRLLLLLLLGSLSRSFHYHNHLFSPLVAAVL